jgi:hypothetical protein
MDVGIAYTIEDMSLNRNYGSKVTGCITYTFQTVFGGML